MSITNRIPLPHPGEHLKEIIDELGISQYRLALGARLPHSRITDIVKGRQGISTVSAIKIARFLGQTPEYWMNLQRNYDRRKATMELGEELEKISIAPEIAALAGS